MSEERKATIFDAVRFYNEMECSNCPMVDLCDDSCADTILSCPKQANEIILKWCDEHPIKTRQSEFLKMFPDTPLHSDGTLRIFPCNFDKEYREKNNNSACCENCVECRREYWNKEI